MLDINPEEKSTKELDKMQKLIQDIDLNIEDEVPPSFYYYKRWLWMTFPWACLQKDQRFSFSNLINQCYSSNLRYLSVKEDRLLTSRKLLFLILIRCYKNRERNKGKKKSCYLKEVRSK